MHGRTKGMMEYIIKRFFPKAKAMMRKTAPQDREPYGIPLYICTMDVLQESSHVRDGLLGLAIGDALGVPFELASRGFLEKEPVTDMVGHKAHDQPAGTWSDDASLTFCTAESLLNGYDPERMGQGFLKWFDEGHWSARGKAFGSGGTTRAALSRMRNGSKAVGAGSTEQKDSGNGSLMRILPLAFYVKGMPMEEQWRIIAEASAITHGSDVAKICCFYYVQFAIGLLQGKARMDIYFELQRRIPAFFLGLHGEACKAAVDTMRRLLDGSIFDLSRESIKSDSYALHTLEASIWCLMTTDAYGEAVLKAVNLGGDSDSTAAVTGGLAGISYGLKDVPERWVTSLARLDDILLLCEKFDASLRQNQFEMDAKDAERPRPYGDGKNFREVPGGHIIVQGPGGAAVFCNDEMQAAEVWEALDKAYQYAFEISKQ